MLLQPKIRMLGSAGLAALTLAVTAPLAQGEWFYTENGARKIVKDAAHKKYGYAYDDLFSTCRPQGARATEPGYKYHRWSCSYGVKGSEDDCDGSDSFLWASHADHRIKLRTRRLLLQGACRLAMH
ncbi:MAG: hypothetical protein JWR30_3760 [Conexibacter sp.]|nr:hypothetical protein [Conexibacter sp.]